MLFFMLFVGVVRSQGYPRGPQPTYTMLVVNKLDLYTKCPECFDLSPNFEINSFESKKRFGWSRWIARVIGIIFVASGTQVDSWNFVKTLTDDGVGHPWQGHFVS